MERRSEPIAGQQSGARPQIPTLSEYCKSPMCPFRCPQNDALLRLRSLLLQDSAIDLVGKTPKLVTVMWPVRARMTEANVSSLQNISSDIHSLKAMHHWNLKAGLRPLSKCITNVHGPAVPSPL